MQEELKITWGECLDSELPIRSGTPLPPPAKIYFYRNRADNYKAHTVNNLNR